MNKKYCIKYKVFFDHGDPLKNKEIKIDKCMSGVHAQVRLEEYLKKKYKHFARLEVEECKEDSIFGQFDDIFGNFDNIFGGK